MEKQLTAAEARKKLLSVWNKCEFGVKERVKNLHSHRTIHYILTTETYSNVDKVLEIIESIKEQSKEVKMEAAQMDKTIQETLA